MPNEGNIKASILITLLKCIFMGCSNENESFTGTLFSNHGPLNMLFHFFLCLIYSVFGRTFVKKFMEKLSFFGSDFKKSISRYSMLQKIRMSNFVVLKWRPFEYKVKGWNFCPFLGLFFQKMLTFWIFMNQIFRKWFLVSHKMTYMGPLLLKLRAVQLKSRTERRLLISN